MSSRKRIEVSKREMESIVGQEICVRNIEMKVEQSQMSMNRGIKHFGSEILWAKTKISRHIKLWLITSNNCMRLEISFI